MPKASNSDAFYAGNFTNNILRCSLLCALNGSSNVFCYYILIYIILYVYLFYIQCNYTGY